MSIFDRHRQELRAILERDYTASLMSNEKWRAMFDALQGLDLWWRLQLITAPEPSGWSRTLQGGSSASHLPHGFVEGCGYSPILMLEIEWLEVQLYEPGARRCLTTVEEVRTHLERVGVPYHRIGSAFRVTGHVRKVLPAG